MIAGVRAALPAIVVGIAALAGLASGACVSKPKPGGLAELTAVPVVAPFDALALPTGEGKVWQCTGPATLRTPAVMHVAYDGVDRMALGGRYSTALMRKDEWVRRKPPTVTPDRWLVAYDEEETGQTLTLQISDSTFDGKVPHGVDVAVTITVARPR